MNLRFIGIFSMNCGELKSAGDGRQDVSNTASVSPVPGTLPHFILKQTFSRLEPMFQA